MAPNEVSSLSFKLPPLTGDEYKAIAAARAAERNSPSQPAASAGAMSDFHNILSGISPPGSGRTSQTQRGDESGVGQQIESFLLALVFKHAFNTRLSSGLFGDSYSSKMYLEMFIDAAAEEAVKVAPLGIADMIEADINRATLRSKDEGNETEELR